MTGHRRLMAVAALVLVAAAVAGCGRPAPGPAPSAKASPSPTAGPYVPVKLPADCAAAAAGITPSAVRDFALIKNASPEPGDGGQLLCSGRGRSPDGAMDVYVLLAVRVMPPYGDDPYGTRLHQWQRENTSSVIDSLCDGRAEVVPGPRLTARCARPVADGFGTAIGATGDDGRVAGASIEVTYPRSVHADQARQYADATARAVVDALLATR